MLNTLKQLACQRAAQEVQDGMVLGLVNGSTMYYFLQELGRMVREGRRLTVLQPPYDRRDCYPIGDPLTTLDNRSHLDLAVDGADEMDIISISSKALGVIAGDKIVAAIANRVVVVVDAGKMVTQLGERYPLPVEVVPFGHTPAAGSRKPGLSVTLRRSTDGQPWVRNGDYILDCHFGPIPERVTLQNELLAIPAVVAVGLFLNMTDMAIVGQANGSCLCSVNNTGIS